MTKTTSAPSVFGRTPVNPDSPWVYVMNSAISARIWENGEYEVRIAHPTEPWSASGPPAPDAESAARNVEDILGIIIAKGKA